MFSNLGQDTQNPDALANMINNAFLDPMQNYPPLDEHILSTLENDAPLVVSEEDVYGHAYIALSQVKQAVLIIYRTGFCRNLLHYWQLQLQ